MVLSEIGYLLLIVIGFLSLSATLAVLLGSRRGPQNGQADDLPARGAGHTRVADAVTASHPPASWKARQRH